MTYIVGTKTGVEIKEMTERAAFVQGAVLFTGDVVRLEHVSLLMQLVYMLLWLLPVERAAKDLDFPEVEHIRAACVECVPLSMPEDGAFMVIYEDGTRIMEWMTGARAAMMKWAGCTVLAYDNNVY